jgi:hypothetical protein
MVVVNLYPFKETIAKAGVTPEQARGNIDIGGPCMIRASAKNFIRVASVVDPDDYEQIADDMDAGKGSISLALRYGWPARPLPTPPPTTRPLPAIWPTPRLPQLKVNTRCRTAEFVGFMSSLEPLNP